MPKILKQSRRNLIFQRHEKQKFRPDVTKNEF